MQVRRLFGLRFVDEPDIGAVVDAILAPRPEDAPGWRVLVTPNVDHIVRYAKSAADRHVAEQATIVLPDGSPVVWASRLVGRRLRARLTGADLFAELWPRLVAERRPVVVLAGNDDVADALRASHPLAECIVPPVFDVSDDVTIGTLADRVRAAISTTGAEFVLLGVSMPKHHRLCAALTESAAPATAPWVLLLGASAEFHVGIRPRAPRWMQRYGLEWLHRLGNDPRSMARRYLVDDMAFVPLVWQEIRDTRSRPSTPPPP